MNMPRPRQHAYVAPNFNVRTLVPAGFDVDFGVSGGTTVAVTDRAETLPKFVRRTQVSAIRLRCTEIPNALATGLVASFLNGTNTFATVVLTTATADQFLDATVVTDDDVNIFAKDVQPTVNVAGTATGASDSLGDFDIWFEIEEKFDLT